MYTSLGMSLEGRIRQHSESGVFYAQITSIRFLNHNNQYFVALLATLPILEGAYGRFEGSVDGLLPGRRGTGPLSASFKVLIQNGRLSIERGNISVEPPAF
jgi:hypothetical protein